MEAASALGVEATGESLRSFLNQLDGSLKNRKVRFAQPTAEEVARLTFGKYRDFHIHAQEGRNRFARLLNRGSSQE